jgi:hypothetical protein
MHGTTIKIKVTYIQEKLYACHKVSRYGKFTFKIHDNTHKFIAVRNVNRREMCGTHLKENRNYK